MKKSIQVFSYAKINLSIDVGEVMPSKMHPVDMVMQQISLRDEVNVSFSDEFVENRVGEDLIGGFAISLSTNRRFLPNNKFNLAWRAATLMIEEYGAHVKKKGTIEISIYKRIPVAAGMAGGSSNAAAVMHALSSIWNLDLSLEELCEKGAELGSDIPFCLISQAKSNNNLPLKVRDDEMAGTCARARGTGTELEVINPLRAGILVATPRRGVSTRAVFEGVDNCKISERPDNDLLCQALINGRRRDIFPQMINVLEEFTLKAYPEVAQLKQLMIDICPNADKVLMSGSGPTVYAVFREEYMARKFAPILKEKNYITFWSRTML